MISTNGKAATNGKASLVNRLVGGVRNMFVFGTSGYEAVESDTKRKQPPNRLTSEDRRLRGSKRRTLVSTVRDAVRNYSLVSWMCRRHLDYVTQHSFRCRVPGKDDATKTFNKSVEDYVDRWSTKERFHVARRHPLRRFIRMAEARRIIDGDFGVLRFTAPRAYGQVQGIEAELIKNPPKVNENETWVDGVLLNAGGSARKYSIFQRRPNSDNTEFKRTTDAANLYLHAWFDSVFRDDMVRGVTPFCSAINTLRDSHEIVGFTKARQKVAQMFGLVLKREPREEINASEKDTDGDDIIDSINFDDGPQLLDLDVEESAEFLENKTNVQETVDMLRFLTQMGLLALDLPVSIFDERDTTFFGGRGALMQYLHATRNKRSDVGDLLTWLSQWRLGLAVIDGELRLPSGLTFDDLMMFCQWVPMGVPWWDVQKEVAGHSAAVAAGFDNFENVVAMIHGGRASVLENIEKNSDVLRFAREKEFPLTLAGVGTPFGEKSEKTSKGESNESDESGDAEDADDEVPNGEIDIERT